MGSDENFFDLFLRNPWKSDAVACQTGFQDKQNVLVYQLGHAQTILYGVEMFKTPGLGPNGFVLKNGPPNNQNRQSQWRLATGDWRPATTTRQKEGYYSVYVFFCTENTYVASQ